MDYLSSDMPSNVWGEQNGSRIKIQQELEMIVKNATTNMIKFYSIVEKYLISWFSIFDVLFANNE